MPNQHPFPWGDAFIIQTPATDKLSDRLYQEQKSRELKQLQDNQALDQMIQKDFGRIRSIDTPEVVGKYNQYKTLKKELLFNKKLQRDPLLYNQAQQAANQAYLDMQNTINGSAEMKEANKAYNAAHLQNPDAFDDNYGQIMATQMNTPLSQLRNHPVYGDLTNADTYRYKGSNTNFNDIVSKIYDKKNKIVGKEEALDNKGIQFRSPVYEYGTTPAQVYEGLVNSLDHKTERDAAYKWKQLSPEVVQKIEQDYNAIPESKWNQMGLPGKQQIDLRGGSDAEKYMRVLAMQNAVNTNPRLVNYENRTSDKAKRDYDFALDKVMEGIKFGHQKALKQQDQTLVDNWIVNYWKQRFGDVSVDKPKAFVVPDPNHPLTQKTTLGKQLNPDQVMMEALKNSGVYPNEVYALEDNRIMPVFYKYKNITNDRGTVIGSDFERDANGNKVIDEDLSKPLKLDQAYLSMGYKGQTKKELGGTMSGAYQGEKETKMPNARKYDIDGKTYTHDQLRKMYSEEKIKEYLDAGIIK